MTRFVENKFYSQYSCCSTAAAKEVTHTTSKGLPEEICKAFDIKLEQMVKRQKEIRSAKKNEKKE